MRSLIEAYVIIKNRKLFLFEVYISTLNSDSAHVSAGSVSSKKLLMKRNKMERLIGYAERTSYTLAPFALLWASKVEQSQKL